MQTQGKHRQLRASELEQPRAHHRSWQHWPFATLHCYPRTWQQGLLKKESKAGARQRHFIKCCCPRCLGRPPPRPGRAQSLQPCRGPHQHPASSHSPDTWSSARLSPRASEGKASAGISPQASFPRQSRAAGRQNLCQSGGAKNKCSRAEKKPQNHQKAKKKNPKHIG